MGGPGNNRCFREESAVVTPLSMVADHVVIQVPLHLFKGSMELLVTPRCAGTPRAAFGGTVPSRTVT